MRYLTFGEVVALHEAIIARFGGAAGVRDLAALESALAQPRATFAGSDLHPTLNRGNSEQQRLLLVSFTERAPKVRIISARPATRRERQRHEENVKKAEQEPS
jgi:uncharacterized DUF497 family protein